MSWRKGSTGSIETSGGSGGSRGGGSSKAGYPFALALRIRVVQIVCGIAAVVMGSVAAIEERGQVNLSLGVPAGAVTVLAAAWSVHRSVHRTAGGLRGGAWCARVLWAMACSLQFALLVLAIRTAINRHSHGEDHTSNTSLALAVVHGVLASSTLVAAGLGARLRYVYGPAPSAPPPHTARCPRSTSHTAVSMVPLTINFTGQTNSEMNGKTSDNLSSDNEMMEISIADNKISSSDIDSSPEAKSPQKPSTPAKVQSETKTASEGVKFAEDKKDRIDTSQKTATRCKFIDCNDVVKHGHSNMNNKMIKNTIDVCVGLNSANDNEHCDDKLTKNLI